MISKLRLVRHRLADPLAPPPGRYTQLELFVPQPTQREPHACIMVSYHNAHQKLFFRVADLEDYDAAVALTDAERARLLDGLTQARRMVEQLRYYAAQEAQSRRLPELPDETA